MKLYEIDAAIYDLVDPDTGEITDHEAFEGLQLARAEKCENIALYYKNLTAEAEAIKAEETKLAERRKGLENKAQNLLEYLNYALQGEKLETPRVKCAYRKTQAVVCDDSFLYWAEDHAPELLTYKEPQPNKTKIKEAIKAGFTVEHAQLIDGTSFSVK